MRKKTMKRKLFLSNLVMVVFPVVLMAAFAWGFLELVQNIIIPSDSKIASVENLVTSVETTLDAVDVNMLLTDVQSQKDLEQLVKKDGYHVMALNQDKIVFSNLEKDESRYLNKYVNIDSLKNKERDTFIQRIGATIVIRTVEQNGEKITFIATGSTELGILGNLNFGSLVTIGASAVAIVVAAIFAIILFSMFLSQLMIRQIMSPIQRLADGAKRIQTGNFDEEITGVEEEELKDVCDSFNSMQIQVKATLEQNQKYEKARTNMISGISHDLRTPLTSVKGYIKGVQDGVANTPEKREKYLDVAYRKACEMDILLQKLFFFSKMETGNMPLHFVETDLDAYLKGFVAAFNIEKEETHAEIALQSSGSDHFVQLDPEQMHRVLANIVENSIKYRSKEWSQIRFSLVTQSDEEVIIIQDDGDGVPAEKIDLLFEQFYRVDEARSTTKEGNGLGLYIVKYIVEQHGGSVKAENHDGLRITITLPRVKREGKG
ncbi:sensor histidine kinase [Trichococcus patagoniensis]|nr:HAMP domain-containing sensor histidine kinase [Trichococcus patagoniensis]